ncbi:MAG: hypothetical protein LQ340_005175, partial [Diploschistes diacapsis]
MSAVMSSLPFMRADPADLPPGIDPFTITTKTGFLPLQPPLPRLPGAFDALSNILDDMPILKKDGTPGLLASFKLGPLIDSGALPDLTSQIDKLVVPGGTYLDMKAVTAAFRDYSFVASGYLLEPCWKAWSANPAGGYGLGRQTLPKCIAGPLVKCAEMTDRLGIPAFMSYAASYALYNYYLADPAKGHDEYTNLRLIRAFEQGLDPTSSEAGFILTHVHMVTKTGSLIEGAIDLLLIIEGTKESGSQVTEAITPAKAAIATILDAMAAIEANMEKMWHNSLPKEYMTYRTFIYGIASQSMFPSGVVYEGQYNNVPQFFRGESGANDAIIPLLDHLCEIPMPANPLTDILKEFREYRPKPHREFLALVMNKAARLGVRDFMTNSGDFRLALMYLRVLDHVRSFRWRHWMFAREYIIKRTKYPVATGGSPIIT